VTAPLLRLVQYPSSATPGPESGRGMASGVAPRCSQPKDRGRNSFHGHLDDWHASSSVPQTTVIRNSGCSKEPESAETVRSNVSAPVHNGSGLADSPTETVGRIDAVAWSSGDCQ